MSINSIYLLSNNGHVFLTIFVVALHIKCILIYYILGVVGVYIFLPLSRVENIIIFPYSVLLVLLLLYLHALLRLSHAITYFADQTHPAHHLPI